METKARNEVTMTQKKPHVNQFTKYNGIFLVTSLSQ